MWHNLMVSRRVEKGGGGIRVEKINSGARKHGEGVFCVFIAKGVDFKVDLDDRKIGCRDLW